MALFGNLPSFTELITRVIAGDEEAQWKLFNQCEPQIHRYVRRQLEVNRCVQPDQDSLEITNWVLYKSLDPERLKSLKNPEVFLSWVYAIAKNDLIAHLRQCTKNLPINLEEQDSSLPSGRIRNSSEIVEASEGIQQILIRAKSVDSRLPHILDLELQGFSDQEIGERLRITPQNVRTIRSRGLLKIKSMLNEPKQ